jgi:hypothetical protein
VDQQIAEGAVRGSSSLEDLYRRYPNTPGSLAGYSIQLWIAMRTLPGGFEKLLAAQDASALALAGVPVD